MMSYLIIFGAAFLVPFTLIMACHFLPAKDHDENR